MEASGRMDLRYGSFLGMDIGPCPSISIPRTADAGYRNRPGDQFGYGSSRDGCFEILREKRRINRIKINFFIALINKKKAAWFI